MSQKSENILDVRLINVADIDIEESNQPREKVERIEELAKSIETVGQLSPINVVAVGQRFRLIDGHRRLAAVKLNKQPRIQASVFADEGEAKEHLYSLVANANREQLTPAEEAQALHRCLFELPADIVAGGYGLDIQKVEAAKRGAKHVESYETQSIDQLLALDEFADDERIVKAIIGAKDNWELSRIISAERSRRVREAAIERAKSEAIGNGAVWLDKDPDWSAYISQTNPDIQRHNVHLDASVPIKPDKPCGCDGYSAWMQYDGIKCGCTKPENHGFTIEPVADIDPEEQKRIVEERRALADRYEGLSAKRIEFLKENCEKHAALIGKSRIWNIAIQRLLRSSSYSLFEYTEQLMGEVISIEDITFSEPKNIIYTGVSQLEGFLIEHIPYDRIGGYYSQSIQSCIDYLEWLHEAGYDSTADDKAVLELLKAAIADGDE